MRQYKSCSQTCNDDESEIRYRKKKHRSVKKSDHKHLYEEVLLHCVGRDVFGAPQDCYSRGERCTICGRLNRSVMFETERDEVSGYLMLLHDDEVYAKYKGVLPIVEVDDQYGYRPHEVNESV